MIRDSIIDFLRKELIGPDPVHPYVQEDGEEIIFGPPRLRYGAGVLFPSLSNVEKIDAIDNSERDIYDDIEHSQQSDIPEAELNIKKTSKNKTDENNGADDDIISLSNAQMPSAMGFSCFLNIPEVGFEVSIKAGRYNKGDFTEKDGEGVSKLKVAYFREKIDQKLYIKKDDLPTMMHRTRDYKVIHDEKETGLELNIRNRTTNRDFGDEGQFYTFTFINRLSSSDGKIINDDCFFQVEFDVRALDDSACFIPYPKKQSTSNIEDEESASLLYRNHNSYAIGHGCAPSWKEIRNEAKCTRIIAETLPIFDMKPIVPTEFDDLKLSMYGLSSSSDSESLITTLKSLCSKYEEWINSQEILTKRLEAKFTKAANRHIKNCRTCLSRMREGVELIEQDSSVKRAFSLMNRAMLTQQLRYGLKLREWNVSADGKAILDDITYPDIHDKETWPESIKNKVGYWRPFQIAFILMNLESMVKPECDERKIVDIIWFPTGGGKTEAYLGLSAFTIFHKKLRNKEDSGTTVLMRYTLRLLTAQQYQRAASLICACEMIRKENVSELGDKRITIGLWVGKSLTPNKREDAIKAFNNLLNNNYTDDNPFVMLKCPWCGSQMGQITVGKTSQVKGYKKIKGPKTVVFLCNDETCDFSKKECTLPLLVIDEDIYDTPPTLLIGTVDKFAMLPWRPEAKSLFGLNEKGGSPPELIIQDELHLISGPLGSMVGHYETFISELCRDREKGINAKIIASTATISRAKEQAHALYNCGEDKVFQFPPQCINANETFFAHEEKSLPGRVYVGVHASGLPSHATTQVRVISALLQATKSCEVADEKNRDPYWTIVNYFNSLRELGHAATLITADIREYLNSMYHRKRIFKGSDKEHRRFIRKVVELTSRVPNSQIPQTLQSLEVNYVDDQMYNDKNITNPVDICLASNMISVGVDVSRLGLMTVIGQPKTTAEYIQATSRVGRSKDGPGLVVTIYNTGKPRDRSHYEHFYSFHTAIYSHVEPTSVTPFSAPVRERALHALLVGFVRFLGNGGNTQSPQPLPDKMVLDKIKTIIGKRISDIEPEEMETTLKLLNEKISEWNRYLPSKYGDFSPPTEELPLMYPAGSSPLDEWEDKSWGTPSSMRNVDANCEAKVIQNYKVDGEEEY
jgi:hypothetical protein